MTRGKPLDERYFEWLYKMIGAVSNPNPDRSHWQLAKVLFKTKFLYFIPNDNNRALDGVDLREEFLDQHPGIDFTVDWLEMDCSMLEMMIAIAKRADFESDSGTMLGGVGGWFWKLMDNIDLSKYTDSNFTDDSLEEIIRVLDRINDRKYKTNGRGGLFPLRRTTEDQRYVELWYQLSAYLLENKYVIP